MPDYVSKLIETALAEIGYLEKASNNNLNDKTANAGSANYTKYGAWYPMQAQPWCAMFVSWCAEQAGIPTSIIPKHASCYVGVSFFSSKGLFHLRSGYTPKVGDIVYFSSSTYPSGGAHVGIVYAVDSAKVYTIEGNTSGGSTLISNGGGVAKKSYTLAYANIYGYGSPDYGDTATVPTATETVNSVRYTVTTTHPR